MRSSPTAPDLDRTNHSVEADASATRVVVWRAGSRAALDAHLQACRAAGWHVERCVPRVVEGPAYGALIVLRRADRPVRDGDGPEEPTRQRAARRPQPRPLPSPPATPNATAA
jgi:hypothetical protein